MRYILGISAYYHDSAAALLVDGKVIAAAQEERFTRVKHDSSFPKNAVSYCFDTADISIDQIDAVVFYEKPFQKFERIIDTHVNNAPFKFLGFKKAMKSWFGKKLWLGDLIAKELGYSGKVKFAEHHQSHGASAFYSSPFHDSLVITMDAVGEKECISLMQGEGQKLSPLKTQSYPDSLGLFYSAFTYYCGFKVNSGEYKLMGLAPYGIPKYVSLIKQHFINIDDNGIVKLKMSNYGFDGGLKMLSKKGIKVLGQPQRMPESKMTQFYMDIAASVQAVLEDVVVSIVRYGLSQFPNNNLCLSGGIALNCKANQKIKESFPDLNVWIQPASGDAGGALGAAQAYFFAHQERILVKDSPINHAYLGPSFSEKEIKKCLEKNNVHYTMLDDESLFRNTAKYLHEELIIGWFQGKMEFGPRALGNRSIIASPLPLNMKSRLNLAIKKREGFRPFAPIVLKEKASEWFHGLDESKYMLQTFNSVKKDIIPSCVHEDNTCRVQTVLKEDNERLYRLLSCFEQESGVPVLINTSFNLRGEPIVCDPEDALNCFSNTEMDVLVMGNYVVLKSENEGLKPSKKSVYELD